jgi:hypothetical protein
MRPEGTVSRLKRLHAWTGSPRDHPYRRGEATSRAIKVGIRNARLVPRGTRRGSPEDSPPHVPPPPHDLQGRGRWPDDILGGGYDSPQSRCRARPGVRAVDRLWRANRMVSRLTART